MSAPPVRGPLGRVLLLARFELRKLAARRLTLVAFALVVLVAVLAPRAGQVVDTAAALARGRASQADPFANGWSALAGAVSTARFFIVLVVLVLASSAVAEEVSLGTLKALLVRPFRKLEVLAAKALAVWLYGAALVLAAVVAAALGAELSRGLYDVTDPFYPDLTKHTAGLMANYVLRAALATLAPVVALTGLGLLASTLSDHPGHATGLGVAGLFLLSGLAGLSDAAQPWVFVTHARLPFETVEDMAQQISGAAAGLAPARALFGAAVSLGWGAGLLGLAGLVLVRRDV